MKKRGDLMEILYDRLKRAGYVGLLTIKDGSGSRSRWIGRPGEGEDLDISVTVKKFESEHESSD